MAGYPRVTADLGKIRHNAATLTRLCKAHGVSAAAVTKVVCADERISRVLAESGACMLADSRIRNLAALQGVAMQTEKPRLLLRAPAPSEAAEAVSSSEAMLVSECDTIRALEKAAEKKGVRVKIILMIDMGDLREGVFYTQRTRILLAARAVQNAPHLELYGVGTNLTCYGAILPDEGNLGALCEIADWLRRETGERIPLVSGGNSSSLGLMQSGRMPKGVNHLRLGESILLGNDTASCRPIEGLYSDAFIVSAKLIEVQTKPSKPIGTSGANAFGERVEIKDEGEQTRGILNIGRQDTIADGLSPLDAGLVILGASSDHLIVNLTNSVQKYAVGDRIEFVPNYGALLAAYTSAYVEKTYLSVSHEAL